MQSSRRCTLPLSAASALSFLKPENQDVALHLTDLGYKLPTERIEYLKKVEKAGKLDEITMRKVLDGENVLEPPKVGNCMTATAMRNILLPCPNFIITALAMRC